MCKRATFVLKTLRGKTANTVTPIETARRVYGEHLADYPAQHEFAVSTGYNASPNRRAADHRGPARLQQRRDARRDAITGGTT